MYVPASFAYRPNYLTFHLQIELWELAGPYMEYMDARDVFTEAKKETDKAKAKLNELIGRNRPLVDLQT